MSQAEALLASLAEEVPEHIHSVTDSDTYFIIDPITRKLENTARKKNVIMQYDHESEVLTFELPRYVEGHDMLLCNRVYAHWNNIGTKTGREDETVEEIADLHELTDLQLNPDNPDTVICSWLIKRQSTQLVGILSFLIQYACVDDAGNMTYEWHTDFYEDMEVRKGRKNSQAAIAEYTDILEQWYARIFGTADGILTQIDNASTEAQEAIKSEGASQVQTIQQESSTQQSAIEAKGQETLDSIPPDYTEMYRMAEEAMRTKADAIVVDAEGEIISVSNASDDPLQSLRIFGKTEQVKTNGYQLFDVSKIPSKKENGVTLTNNGDGSLTISGSGAMTEYFSATHSIMHDELVKLLKVGPLHLVTGRTRPYFVAYILDSETNERYVTMLHTSPDCEITQEMLDNEKAIMMFSFYGSPGEEIIPGTIKPMLYQDGDGTWEPYSGGKASPNPEWPQELESIENPVVSIASNNLLKHADGYSANQRGITCEYEGDGVYHIHGTYDSTNPSIQFVDLPLNILIDDPNTKYTLHGELLEGTPPDDFHPYLGLRTKQTSHMNWAAISIDNRMKVGDVISITRTPSDTTSTPTHINKFWIYAHNDTLESYTADFRFRVWLTKSDAPMPYEPYSEQTLAIQRTIPGVPVNTGGTYTDVNGQEWVADEVVYDYPNGKWQYIQRVDTYTLTGSETLTRGSDNWQKEGLFSFYLNYVLNESVHASDDVGYFEDCLSNQCMSNMWEWTLPRGLNNIAARKGIVYVSLDNKLTGILSDDIDEVKLSKAKSYLAEKYASGDPITVQYILATPIIHELTTEEVLAFKALRTNKPNTVIQNGVGAYMIAEYAADTEIFMRECQPKPTDEQVQNAVDAYLDETGVQVPSDDHIRALIDEALGEIVNGEY